MATEMVEEEELRDEILNPSTSLSNSFLSLIHFCLDEDNDNDGNDGRAS